MSRCSNLCCVSLTLGARMIAALGLSLSILMVNVVLSYFFGHTETEFMANTDLWTLLGLHWTYFVNDIDVSYRAVVLFSCLLGFLSLNLIACTLLAIGTVSRKPRYAIMWLYLQMTTIGDQIVALIFELSPLGDSKYLSKTRTYQPLAIAYLFLSVYCWIVVYAARDEWMNKEDDYDDTEIFRPTDDLEDEIRPVQESQPEKSPSFLSQNYDFFQRPPSPLPGKYNIV